MTAETLTALALYFATAAVLAVIAWSLWHGKD
jgi:hypothetical protein